MVLREKYPYFLANEAVYENEDLVVTDKYTNKPATRVALADSKAIDQGIAASVLAAPEMEDMPSFERQQILEHCVTRFRERSDELAYALCIEAGKPIKDSEGEVSRLIDTFKIGLKPS